MVETECAHCGRSIHIELDSSLNYAVREPDADPLLFIPIVDFSRIRDKSIINVF